MIIKTDGILPIFYRFLKENNIYNSYLYHCRNYFSQDDEKIIHFFSITNPRYFLSSAFSWDETEEGFDFWDNKRMLWGAYINRINKKL